MPPKARSSKTPARKAAAKKATRSTARKTPAKKATRKTTASKAMPTFGRPGTAGKADGDDAVKAWITGVKPEHRALVARLDALVDEVVPDVKRAVKWSMPMYGREGIGWFAHIGSFKAHVALGFFAGDTLTPPIPAGDGKGMRRANFRSLDDVDEKVVRGWLKQAAATKGWGKV